MSLTPMQRVLANFRLPFDAYNYQADTVNQLAPIPISGHYLAVGVGKTFTSTACALYKLINGECDQGIVLLPPILMLQWKRWLESIYGIDAIMYRGTPKQRNKLGFNARFTLMTYPMFKLDGARIKASFNHRRTVVIADEATAIKNIGSGNYQAFREFTLDGDGHGMLLTGTPLSQPQDAYAYISLTAPHLYRNFNHFRMCHITDNDFFGRPSEYQNLDLLAENLKVNSVRILKEDVLDQLPEITYTPIHYELAPDHIALYNKLVEEQLIQFPDGSKFDATEATRLWHACQQIVCNYGYFTQDRDKKAACYELIDETMDEVGDRKLIIFTNYQLTSRSVTEYCQMRGWGAVPLYGAISASQQDKNIDRFMSDPSCRVLVAQVKSGGYGLNPQSVCSDVLFLEEPLVPIDYEQAVGRVYRNGQRNKVHIRVAVAEGTIQNRLLKLLMDKDALVNQVVRNFKDIRDALYGN
jgi:SNF2 family DNA or RNA helicase